MHSIPNYRKLERVAQDANQDEIVELFWVAKVDHEISEELVCLRSADHRLGAVAELQCLNPGLLNFFQEFVKWELLLFIIKWVYDDTNEQI